jgi:hypothetical protein
MLDSINRLIWRELVHFRGLGLQPLYVGGGEKGYQNGGEVVPCQGSRSE